MKKALVLFFLAASLQLSAQTSPEIIITGTVYDNVFNETLVGVAVVIEGITIGEVTDIDGNYSIKVPSPETVLVFSYLGYTSKEIKVGRQTVINVRIPPSDANTRELSLSSIFPELLSDIEVFKSPTADMDGDGIGGTNNLGVAKAPKNSRQQIRLYGGYNTFFQDASMRSFNVGGTEEGLKYTRSYTDQYLRFDASLSYRIGKNLTAMASLANITGEDERRFMYQRQFATDVN